MAEKRQVPWLALYVESHRHATLPESVRRDITQALHLAENLGGETLTVASEDVAGEILRVARESNVSVIIIGKSKRSLWSRLMRPSVAAAVLDRGDSFDIMVMSGGEAQAAARASDQALPGSLVCAYRLALLRCSATAMFGIASFIAWGASHLTDFPFRR